MPVDIDQVNALVVEDNDSDFRLLQEYDKQILFDINMERETSVKKAIENISSKHYDVVLLDLHLDDSEGIQTVESIVKALKYSKHNSHTGVVVMTGTEDWKLAKMSLDKGAKDYIKKEEMSPDTLGRSINMATYQRNLPLRKKKGFFNF